MGRIVAVNFVRIDGVLQAPLLAEEDRDGGFTAGGWAEGLMTTSPRLGLRRMPSTLPSRQ